MVISKQEHDFIVMLMQWNDSVSNMSFQLHVPAGIRLCCQIRLVNILQRETTVMPVSDFVVMHGLHSLV